MRTVSFKSVLHGAGRLFGLDPDTPDLDDVQAANIAEYITERCREGWEHAFWPELMRVEMRQYRPDWDVATAYAAGDEALGSDEKYYRAVIGNTGNDPSTDDGTNWAVPVDFDPFVAYEQAGETAIDAVERISKQNPRTSQFPGYLDFFKSENGFQLAVYESPPAKVWLRFRLRAPAFTSAPWSTTIDYSAGDVAYVATSGECYAAVIANTGYDPTVDDGTQWARAEFPYWLSGYVKRAVYSDLLVEDGQRGEAGKQLGIAMDMMANQELVEFDQQGQVEMAEQRGY